MDIQYVSVEPEQIKASYNEFDTIDFMINTDRNIINNSIRIEGNVLFSQDGTNKCDDTTNTFYNHRSGIHGIVESISTQLGGNGPVAEYLSNYGRYVNMKEAASKDADDYFNSADICELKCGDYNTAKDIVRGKAINANPVVFELGDFSFKPMFCLNRMNGNSLSLKPYQDIIKVSINLARNQAFLCGSGVTNASRYEITNLRLTYRTIPNSPTPNVSCNSYVSLKQTINGPRVNINTRVPAVASGVAVSFLQQAKENVNIENNYQLEKPPIMSSVKFSFNDVTSGNFITYPIEDQGEMVDGFLMAMAGNSDRNQVNPSNQKGNNGFGIGANFASMVDLRNQKFTFEMESSINNISYLAFMYFNTIVSL